MTSIIPKCFALLNTAAARLHRLRKTVLNSARLIDNDINAPGFRPMRGWFVTLTYKDCDKWEPYHVTQYVDSLKAFARARKIKVHYVWVAELQKRGAVHYHVMVWLPRGVRLPKPDAAGWWRFGSSNRVLARNPVGYMAKYASKSSSKAGERFPAGIRLHGAGGLSARARAEVRWWNFPKWVRELQPLSEAGDLRRRLVGGGVVNLASGEVMQSEYERVMFASLSGEKHVIFRRKDSDEAVPKFLRDCRTVSRVSNAIVMPDGFASLKTGYRFAELAAARAEIVPGGGALDRIDWLLSLPSELRDEELQPFVNRSLAGWVGLPIPF